MSCAMYSANIRDKPANPYINAKYKKGTFMKPEKIKSLDKAHIMHSWSVQSQLDPLAFDHGKGAVMWDVDGNRYLDFSSQLVNLNICHQHPDVVNAIKEWSERCCYINPAYAY